MLNTILVSIITALITALATATITYIGYWRQVAADLKKEYGSRLNERKWKAYMDFILMQSRLTSVLAPEGAEIKAALLLVASDEVVRAYNGYVTLSFQVDKREERAKTVGEMIAEMRKDLGYASKVNSQELWTMLNSIAEP